MVGTRPEVIKVAPVVFAARREGIETIILNTGQHRDLSADALAGFGLASDIDLDVMTESQSPSDVAAKVLVAMGPVLREINPSWVLVQGDTTTVLAAGIAASYEKIPLGHIEAGLRSHDRSQPFPEEINRRVVGSIADLHFAPTQTAANALLSENVEPHRVLLTGNTVIDALHWACAQQPRQPDDPRLAKIDTSRPMVLFTTHRRENFGPKLHHIFDSVETLLEARPDLQFVYPVHPNPEVRAVAYERLGHLDSVTLTDPLSYLDIAWLLDICCAVLTDSGGLQEEGPALAKQVVVLREVTERPEAVDVGMAHLVGTDPSKIVPQLLAAVDNQSNPRVSPYGDGQAAERIVDALLGREVVPFIANQGRV